MLRSNRSKTFFGVNPKASKVAHQHMVDQLQARHNREDKIRPDEARFIMRRIPTVKESNAQV